MAENPLGANDDEFREMMRKFLSGDGDIDPAQLAGAAGLPSDPVMMARLMGQLRKAMIASGDGIDWQSAREEAGRIARGLGALIDGVYLREALDHASAPAAAIAMVEEYLDLQLRALGR